MATRFNTIFITGFLGREPEGRYLPSGTAVCDFTVATSERRHDKEGTAHEQTTWFRCSAIGPLAETCLTYLHTGSYVHLEGRLSQRAYTDRAGVTRTSLEVRLRDMQMLDRRAYSTQKLGVEDLMPSVNEEVRDDDEASF